jgi:type IV secretory pathway VirB4 component
MLTPHLRLRRHARRATTMTSEPADLSGGLPTPDAIQVGPRWLRVGGTWCRTLAVTGYPHEVPLGWLEPVLAAPGTFDVALHIEPIPPLVAAERLRRQLARLESTRRLDSDKGRLADFHAEAAADDAAELARRLARGQGRLFRVGLYVTIRAHSETELDEQTDAVRALLGSLLLTSHPATFRTLQGWATTLPIGVDALKLRRTFDTQALAAGFPFASAELPHTNGVLYGRNLNSQGLVFWNRFTQRNYNAVLLAPSGSGKSYLAKLEALRWLYRGVEVFIVDPEREYQRLAEAVGGTSLRLGAAGVRLNPFDLPTPTGTEADREALTRRALFLHTLISVLLGQPPGPEEAAALDRTILDCYKAKGITADPRTHTRPTPLLRDLAAALTRDAHRGAKTLAARLEPFVTGSHRGLFDGPTTARPEGHLVVFSLRELPDELAAVGTLLVLDAIWRQVANPAARRRRLVLVDEAWLLLRDPVGARYLFRLAKSARKHWTGLTVATQDAADLLASELGQAVVANAATQILLGQAPQTIEQVARAFRLSGGERQFLLAAQPGEGLLLAGEHRVAFTSLASPSVEHPVVTSDPAELAELHGDHDPDDDGAAL